MTESTVNPLASPSVRGEIWTDYMWLVIVGALVSFAMAWGIGANDVANSFGTSVGAKTITIFQACLIAMFMEFGGAIALGGAVTSTISGGIARITYFYDEPEIFAFGMLTALCAASIWVAIATYLKLAVSTTHSIVGAVLGFALVYGGVDAVVWDDSIPEFPYAKGLVPIICSWFVSPICSSVVAAFLFFTNRFLILRRKNGTKYALWSFPVLLLVTVFINIFFVLYKGAKNELHWDANHAAWVAAIVAAGCGVAGVFPGIWLMKWRMQKAEDKAAEAAAAAESNKDGKDVESNEEETKTDELPSSKSQRLMRAMSKAFMHGVSKDVHATVEMDEKVASMHANAEVFDPKTEHVYQYLQVFSACCVSFAHGANDVANAVGPFAGIWAVYTGFIVSSKASTPRWILAMGGAGIVVGLWTYGYNIIQTLGVGMAKMTPSRGFCAELATSFTVVIASAYSLPISTTHCIVGAEVGIGLTENLRHGTNFKLFAKTFAAWVFTIIVAAFVSAALFSVGAYAPSVTMGDDIQEYEQSVRGVINTMNAALTKMNNYTNVTFGYSNSTVVNSIKWTQGNLTNWFNVAKVQGYLPPQDLLRVLNGTVALMFQNSIVTVNYATRNATWTADAITVPHTA